MKIIAVDDERPALRLLEKAIRSAEPDCLLHSFTNPIEALDYAKTTEVDVAFLDISMPGMSGLMLAKQLKDIYGRTNILFVTGHEEHVFTAFAMHASGYVMKPAEPDRIKRELENLRYPVPQQTSGVRIQTFGNFEVFVDEQIVHFKRSKSKEILAYLVDRCGAGVSRKQLAAVIWEDEPYTRQKQKQLQTLIDELKRALSEAGAGSILLHEKNTLAIATSKVKCDYFDFIDWNPAAVNMYRGEYMSDYSWAEITAGVLSEKANQK